MKTDKKIEEILTKGNAIISEGVSTPTTLKEEMKRVKESAREEKHRPDYLPNLTQQSLDKGDSK